MPFTRLGSTVVEMAAKPMMQEPVFLVNIMCL